MFTKKTFLFGVLFSILMLSSLNAGAAVITVDSAKDSYNPVSGDGDCTLREAIINANNNALTYPDCLVAGEPDPVMDEIHFKIFGAGVQIINVQWSLPTVHDSLMINGESQPGTACGSLPDLSDRKLRIELRSVPGPLPFQMLNMFRFDGDPDINRHRFILQGVAIHQTTFAVSIQHAKFVHLACNHLGINAEGTAGDNHPAVGISVHSSDQVIIGGTDIHDANVISNNVYTGVVASGSFDKLHILGNRIGTNVSGQAFIPNLTHGIRVDAETGYVLIEDNLIAGNGTAGVDTSSAIALEQDGAARTSVTITGNRIYSNEGLGIDLNIDGVTFNDDGDTDDGANHLLNFPELLSAEFAGNQLKVKFNLDVPKGSYRIEFFANPSGLDPTGYGEGEKYLGFANVTVDSPGIKQFSSVITVPADIDPQDVINITSTATGPIKSTDGGSGFAGSGATSEFSGGLTQIVRTFYDYGDAPDPAVNTGPGNYRTRKADLGASHKAGKVWLGQCVDGDNGLLHNASADADDKTVSSDVLGVCLSAGDDEDGVRFLSEVLVQGQSSGIEVISSAKGYLSAWIDWNQDGVWGIGEIVAVNVPLNAGINQFSFQTPSTARYGYTYARFRVNTTGGLQSIGPANDGEVEDYMVFVGGNFAPGGEGDLKKWSPAR